MASVNAQTRELVFKIVYCGPGLSGKTTTLQHIHATVRPEHRGKMVSLATPVDRTLYFDFLPIRLPRVREMSVRMQLFTVPGQVYYNATRKLVLTGVDGIVFVSDSQATRTDANLEAFENLRENLHEHGRTLADFPHVIQHNKRDLADLLPMEELDRMLNLHHAASFATVATRGEGVYEALETISKLVITAFESSIPPGERQLTADIEAIEGGLSEALRNAESGEAAEPPSVIASLTVPPAGGVSPPSSVPPGHGRPDRGAEAPGEVAARALLRNDPPASFSVAELWPESDAAGIFGSAEAPRDASTVPLLLGLDGRQYLAFRVLVREARAGAPLEAKNAIEALVFAAQARILRSAL